MINPKDFEIIAKSGGEIVLAPEGNHMARCVNIILIGTVFDETYQRSKNTIRITWELPGELHVFKEELGEQPFHISKEYTLSLGEQANLYQDLVSWRGKAFTPDELKGFNVVNVLGAPCMINLIHDITAKGSKYVKVVSVTPAPKGVVVPPAVSEFKIWASQRPDWDFFKTLPRYIVDKIVSTPEFKSLTNIPDEINVFISNQPAPPNGNPFTPPSSQVVTSDSDLPF